MNEISKRAISSMNYLFLNIIFKENNTFYSTLEEKVKSEIQYFLEGVYSEDLTPEFIDIVRTELEEGDYLDDLSFYEINTIFADGINNILGYDDKIVLSKYISIAKEVYRQLS